MDYTVNFFSKDLIFFIKSFFFTEIVKVKVM